MYSLKKPKNLRYVDLAIYIDNNVYREDLTEDEKNTIFCYIYCLVNMLARKEKLFSRQEYYEDFAFFMSTSVFLRLTSPKQYEYDENGNPKLTKLKSCLNYIKTTMRHRKVDFEQEFYCQTISKKEAKKEDLQDDEAVFNPQYSLSAKLADEADKLKVGHFEEDLGDIPKMVKTFVKKLPYSNDRVMSMNIYVSIMLSLLSNITLSAKDKARLASIKRKNFNRDYELETLSRYRDIDNIILYHLPESMRGYILVLVREVKHLIAKSLSSEINTFISSYEGLNDIIFSEINRESREAVAQYR